MTDRPMIFSASMVRALLEGRKTQTRRLLADSIQALGREPAWEAVKGPDGIWRLVSNATDVGGSLACKERYATGDRLWVREAHAILPRLAYRGSIGTGTIDQREHPTDEYSAAVFREGFDRSGKPLWRPSIHMPRWASRLTLTVTEVRVERLQDIGEADAVAEGVECDSDGWRDYLMPSTQCCGRSLESFRSLWTSIHGHEAWDANPWVCAISFHCIRQNIDAVESTI